MAPESDFRTFFIREHKVAALITAVYRMHYVDMKCPYVNWKIYFCQPFLLILDSCLGYLTKRHPFLGKWKHDVFQYVTVLENDPFYHPLQSRVQLWFEKIIPKL